jgi:hypothetical protein
VTGFLRSQLLMGADGSRVSYFDVSFAEEYGSEEYVVDEAEEDESRYSSGEDIRVRRKKRHKRLRITFSVMKMTNSCVFRFT